MDCVTLEGFWQSDQIMSQEKMEINIVWFIYKFNGFKLNFKWSEVTKGQVWWPILWICALQLTHPKCTHTAVNTQTHCEHTPGAVGSHYYAAAPGEQFGGSVPCSRAPSCGIKGGESTVHSLPPHLQFLPARDLNSKPLDYESDSQPLGHDFPQLFQIV